MASTLRRGGEHKDCLALDTRRRFGGTFTR